MTAFAYPWVFSWRHPDVFSGLLLVITSPNFSLRNETFFSFLLLLYWVRIFRARLVCIFPLDHKLQQATLCGIRRTIPEIRPAQFRHWITILRLKNSWVRCRIEYWNNVKVSEQNLTFQPRLPNTGPLWEMYIKKTVKHLAYWQVK